jgi:hypothetical protein
VKHARPGIAHHGLDLASHGRLEAMDRTLGTSRLSLLEWAFLKTLIGIDQEFTALGARPVTSMLAATVETYHDCHGLAFPGCSGVSLVHGQHILAQKPTPIHKIEQEDSLQPRSSHMPSDISTPPHPRCSQRTPGCRRYTREYNPDRLSAREATGGHQAVLWYSGSRLKVAGTICRQPWLAITLLWRWEDENQNH